MTHPSAQHADRLVRAHAELEDLRSAVEARGPWPPSPHFGTEPEASWNPPELLAHLAEMLPFWLGQLERILDGYPEPVSFGRVQTDDDRLAAIGRDRLLPVGELYDRIGRETAVVEERLRALTAADLERLGTHPTLGEMPVRVAIERFLTAHLEDHVAQLRTILEGAEPAS